MRQPAPTVNARLAQSGVVGGYDLSADYPEMTNQMLVCVTEQNTREQIDAFVKEVSDSGSRGE